jgi:formylglycine-generating enzyme required for sulfatase activity
MGRTGPAYHIFTLDEDYSWDLTNDPPYADDPWSWEPDMPVGGVSFFETYAYCKWLSDVTGDTYRLPTEAEWEYAARGPESYRFPWGNEYLSAEEMCGQPGSGAMAKCWYTLEATDEDKATDEDAAPVGSYPEGVSPWGVYDMAGNVVEMTKDWFQGFYYYKQVRTGDTVDPTGPDGSLPPFFISVKPSWTTPERVYKSWGYAMSGSANSNYNRYLDTSYPLRGAHRTFHDNDLPHSQIGFRVMKEAP